MQFWIDYGLIILGIAAIGGFIVFWYFHSNPDDSICDPSAVPVEKDDETFENPADERELPVDAPEPAPEPAPETQAVFDSDKEPGNFADEVSK